MKRYIPLLLISMVGTICVHTAYAQVPVPDLPPLPDAIAYLPDAHQTHTGYIMPAQGVLSSGYGWRWGRMHHGIDIAAPIGTPILASSGGTVEFAGWNDGGYGYMVELRHPDGSLTRYAHAHELLVETGQSVTQGEAIALIGSTGRSTGPHLHFEIHVPGVGAVNPMSYLV
jgi:murein DD-endopeptidase MepM/ murein hydrolase activator NlpD